MSVTIILFTNTVVRSYTIMALTMKNYIGLPIEIRVGFESDIVGYLRLTAPSLLGNAFSFLNRNYRGTSPYVTI